MPIHTTFFYRGSKEFPMIFIVYWCNYLKGEITLSWEHTEYKWISIEEAINDPKLMLFKEIFVQIKRLKEFIPKDFRL
jgi:hypothetical protein